MKNIAQRKISYFNPFLAVELTKDTIVPLFGTMLILVWESEGITPLLLIWALESVCKPFRRDKGFPMPGIEPQPPRQQPVATSNQPSRMLLQDQQGSYNKGVHLDGYGGRQFVGLK
jgi:hypothetical protein